MMKANLRVLLLNIGSIQAEACSARAFSASSVRGTFLKHSPNAHLDNSIVNRFRHLKYDAKKVRATYLWIDGTGEHLRLKDRIVDRVPERAEDLPLWQYDGSSTGQASGGNSDITLVPRVIYPDPFKIGDKDVLVVCDTFASDGTPTASNKRHLMQDAVDKTVEHEPWFGIEQEYTLLDVNGWPYGWPANGYPAPQGPYCEYCMHAFAMFFFCFTFALNRRVCLLASM